MKDKYFKILDNDKSCNGGDFTWSLPTQNEDESYTPGEWHEIEGELQMCFHGFHVTKDISQWVNQNSQNRTVYEVEIDETKQILESNYSDKIAVKKLRLVVPFTGLNQRGENSTQCVNGKVHSDNDSPAIIRRDKQTREWWKNGALHREDKLPAITRLITKIKTDFDLLCPIQEFWHEGVFQHAIYPQHL